MIPLNKNQRFIQLSSKILLFKLKYINVKSLGKNKNFNAEKLRRAVYIRIW